MHGRGVPRSCQAAVLYYNPVAEQVVELARYPRSIPQVGARDYMRPHLLTHEPTLSIIETVKEARKGHSPQWKGHV